METTEPVRPAAHSQTGIALLIIDMQQDFVLPDSPHCVTGAAETIPTLMGVLGQARKRFWSVFHVIRSHMADGSDAEIYRRSHFQNGKGVCVTGTPGAEIVGELAPLPDEPIIVKRRFSAFFGTSLEQDLKKLGIHTVIITGTQYPNCVRGTAVDALYRDFRVIVVTDACSARDQATKTANLSDLRGMGILCVPSSRLMKSLQLD